MKNFNELLVGFFESQVTLGMSGRIDMLPTLSCTNTVNAPATDAVFLTQPLDVAALQGHRAYQNDIGFRQPGRVDGFATSKRAMPDFITNISLLIAPGKIFDVVICADTIEVARNSTPERARPDECGEHQDMDTSYVHLLVAVQANDKIAPSQGWLQLPDGLIMNHGLEPLGMTARGLLLHTTVNVAYAINPVAGESFDEL